jgi:hypothetical protein
MSAPDKAATIAEIEALKKKLVRAADGFAVLISLARVALANITRVLDRLETAEREVAALLETLKAGPK